MSPFRSLTRSFRTDRGLTLAAIVILSVSIGGATSLFSVVRSALFETVPFRDPEQLVHIYEARAGELRGNAGYETWLDWRDRVESFSHMAVVTFRTYPLTTGGQAEQISALRVSHEFFELLGVRPQIGRDFRPEDDTPDGRRVVILSHGLWQRRFGGDPSIRGRMLTFGGTDFEVIGVLPADYHPVVSTAQYAPADAWMPLGYDRSLSWACRSCGHLRPIGRLADGASIEKAAAELSTIHAAVIDENPGTYPEDERILLESFDEVYVGETARRAFVVIAVALGVLILAAMATLAIMALLRIISRGRALAIRAAVGATPSRLRSELLGEALVIGILGGAGAVSIAVAMNELVATRFRALLPTLPHPRIDFQIIACGIALAMLISGTISVIAAHRLERLSVAGALLQGGRGASLSRSRSRSYAALVVVTLAAGCLLLSAVGMTGRSLSNLTNRDPGFDRANVLTLRISPSGEDYDEDQEIVSFHDRLLDRLRELPGVANAAITSQIPLGGNGDRVGFRIDGRAEGAEAPEVERYVVGEDYFESMRIAIVRGRAFSAEDDALGVPVVIIGETTARRLWPDTDPIGALVRTGGEAPSAPMRRVIGIARDVRHETLGDEPGMQAYFPFRQLPLTWGIVVVRTNGDPTPYLRDIRETAAGLDPRLPVFDTRSFESIVMETEAMRQLVLEILLLLSLITIIISAASVYGVSSHVVARTWKEIGIRQAIGETGSATSRRIIARAATYAGTALVFGLGVMLVAGSPLEKILFEVSSRDPGSLLVAATFTMLVGVGSAVIPAWRAAHIDPITALRQE